MKTDIEIAQEIKVEPIIEIAKKLGIEDNLIPYGYDKAKINDVSKYNDNKDGKLILVTAINPTPAGEGKTTTSIGLADALSRLGKKTCLALREPSLGPVFGVKGGAAGGGYAQVVPMEDINLHFTGDFHAIGAANNLLAAMIDNHIQQGNSLNIDPRRITWHRCVDMNDRQLRYLVDGLNGKLNGTPREDSFDITVASEIMAILCLSKDLRDLKERLSKIIIGYTYKCTPVTAGQLKASGAMAVLLKDAIKPNLVQTLEGTPAIVHGGPFANIAHGCNSIIATKTAMKLADYTVTEAGFGADLGAEKFLDIKCRLNDIQPNAVVLVATIRALKYHGGVPKDQLNTGSTQALFTGAQNLIQHYKNITEVYNLPCIVAINKFPTDTKDDVYFLKQICTGHNIPVIMSDVFAKGGEGGIELAEKVLELCEQETAFNFAYDLKQPIKDKICMLAKNIYKADVIFTDKASKQIEDLEYLGFRDLPICVAKTQYSFSDDPKKLGAPKNYSITIKEVNVSAGAGFLVVMTGDIIKMPGLPKVPAAEKIDITDDGKVIGLF